MTSPGRLASQDLAVIIPAYNEEQWISGVLAALTSQTDQDFTVVLVDNASTDDTVSTARTFDRLDLRVVEEPSPGAGTAADTGFRYAIAHGARLLLRTDADCVPAPDWVATARSYLLAGTEMVCGRSALRQDEHPRGWERLYPRFVLAASLFGRWHHRSRLNPPITRNRQSPPPPTTPISLDHQPLPSSTAPISLDHQPPPPSTAPIGPDHHCQPPSTALIGLDHQPPPPSTGTAAGHPALLHPTAPPPSSSASSAPAYRTPFVLVHGHNLALTAELYLRCGGTPREHLGDGVEDVTLLNRARLVTDRIVRAPDVVVAASLRRLRAWGPRRTLLWHWDRRYRPTEVHVR